jgi:hypothetical protein
MRELHEPQAQGKGNPHIGNSEITSSVPNNSELLEFSLPPRPCEQCGKPFHRRKHGGGSPQRFCNQDCRIAWHSAQRNPACTLEATVIDPAFEQSPEDAPEGARTSSGRANAPGLAHRVQASANLGHLLAMTEAGRRGAHSVG